VLGLIVLFAKKVCAIHKYIIS